MRICGWHELMVSLAGNRILITALIKEPGVEAAVARDEMFRAGIDSLANVEYSPKTKALGLLWQAQSKPEGALNAPLTGDNSSVEVWKIEMK